MLEPKDWLSGIVLADDLHESVFVRVLVGRTHSATVHERPTSPRIKDIKRALKARITRSYRLQIWYWLLGYLPTTWYIFKSKQIIRKKDEAYNSLHPIKIHYTGISTSYESGSSLIQQRPLYIRNTKLGRGSQQTLSDPTHWSKTHHSNETPARDKCRGEGGTISQAIRESLPVIINTSIVTGVYQSLRTHGIIISINMETRK